MDMSLYHRGSIQPQKLLNSSKGCNRHFPRSVSSGSGLNQPFVSEGCNTACKTNTTKMSFAACGVYMYACVCVNIYSPNPFRSLRETYRKYKTLVGSGEDFLFLHAPSVFNNHYFGQKTFNECFLFFPFLKYYIFIYFWPCHTVCGTSVLQPGIEPVPPALEAQSLNHWTTREVPMSVLF